MRNILITGGAGFIGSNFVRMLLNKDKDLNVYVVDKLTYSGSLENLKFVSGIQDFIIADICNKNKMQWVLEYFKIDTLVHFAAETHVDRSILSPEPFINTNIVGTFNLLEQIRLSKNAIRLHHISTDEVFGTLSPVDPAWTEQSPYAPKSPYSASKAAADHLVRAYGNTYDLNYTITNCSNNYGANQYPEKLIPLVILNALEGKPIPIYGDGKQVRDWVYVEDHCEAIWNVLLNGDIGESYNVGGKNQPTNLEIVETICDILDAIAPKEYSHRDLITFVADRPGHDRRYAMDTTKTEQKIGWKPRHEIHSGLRKTVEWYVRNKEWVDAIKGKEKK